MRIRIRWDPTSIDGVGLKTSWSCSSTTKKCVEQNSTSNGEKCKKTFEFSLNKILFFFLNNNLQKICKANLKFCNNIKWKINSFGFRPEIQIGFTKMKSNSWIHIEWHGSSWKARYSYMTQWFISPLLELNPVSSGQPEVQEHPALQLNNCGLEYHLHPSPRHQRII